MEGREEATSKKKIGSEKTWFMGEMDCWCCVGEGTMIPEKDERKGGTYSGTHKDNTSLKPLAGKMRRADVHEFLQPAGLED